MIFLRISEEPEKKSGDQSNWRETPDIQSDPS